MMERDHFEDPGLDRWITLTWIFRTDVRCRAYPGFEGEGVTPGIFSGRSTNSVEDRGQREWESGGSSPLVRGFAQFA
jgi:hypothetical protein